MRPILIPALVVAALSVPALAVTTAQHQAIGMVKTWNAQSRVVTLDSGATYTVEPGTTASFQRGEKVKLIYQFRDGRNIASEASVVK